jgi:hypothetical protein
VSWNTADGCRVAALESHDQTKGLRENQNDEKTQGTALTSEKSSHGRRKFTVEEDAELLRMREQAMPLAPWPQIAQAYNSHFFPNTRDEKNLSNRYNLYLGTLASLHCGVAATNARAAAIAYWNHASRSDGSRDLSKGNSNNSGCMIDEITEFDDESDHGNE